MSKVLLDPTGERSVPHRERLPRPSSLDGHVIALLDISKPRGDVFLDQLSRRLAEGGAQVRRYKKPTFTKPAPGRPPPGDRHAVHAGDRSARRLRQLYVVQCARHRRSRASGPSRRLRRVRRVHPGGRRAVGGAGLPRRGASFTPTRSRIAPTTRCATTPTRRTRRSCGRSRQPEPDALADHQSIGQQALDQASGTVRGARHHQRRVGLLHRRRRECLQQTPSGLPVTPLEPRLRAADAGGTDCRIGADPGVATLSLHRALRALRRGRTAQDGTEIHQALVPLPRLSHRQRVVGCRLNLPRQ